MSNLYVTEVLLFDVLSRVPAKSLLRFRCVSKSWRDLIESRSFSKTYMNRIHSNSKIIVCSYSDEKYSIYTIDCITKQKKQLTYPPILEFKKGTGFELLGSTNGVICIRYANRRIVIWNPLSQGYIEIFSPQISYHSFRSSYAYGFAYEKTTNDYKVMWLITILDKSGQPVSYHGWIYSLNSQKWKRLENFGHVMESGCEGGVLVNGALHWITKYGLILCFNLANEIFYTLPHPNYSRNVIGGKLGVLGDRLSLIVRSDIQCEFQIWVMTDYGDEDSWTLTSFESEPHFRRNWFLRPISYLGNNREVLIIQDSKKQFHSYNLNENSAKKIAAIVHDRLKACPYTETIECCDFTRYTTSGESSRLKRIGEWDINDKTIDMDGNIPLSWKRLKQ